MAEKKAVSFNASDLSEGKSKKQPPTQKYDRKEIQKRLDIENWMDEELKRIYGVEVNCCTESTLTARASTANARHSVASKGCLLFLLRRWCRLTAGYTLLLSVRGGGLISGLRV